MLLAVGMRETVVSELERDIQNDGRNQHTVFQIDLLLAVNRNESSSEQ